MALLKEANELFMKGEFEGALDLYLDFKANYPEMENTVNVNIKLAKRELKKNSSTPCAEKSSASKLSFSGVYSDKLAFLRKSRGYTKEVDERISCIEQQVDKFIEGRGGAPLVSIIMPTYNRGSIIHESIATVVDQTYENFELIICDDGSYDETEAVVKRINDDRIIYVKQDNMGAAAARNNALLHAKGQVIAYLDTDNYWHPRFLEVAVEALEKKKGHSAVYFDFIDYRIDKNKAVHINATSRPRFSHEELINKPFIDLNTFVHKRELYELFGGFDDELTRRQDYDLILKYTWLRDPIHVKIPLALYQRNDNLEQITRSKKNDKRCVPVINKKIENYFSTGLPTKSSLPIKKVTVIVWDICRNHFSKPFSVAEALSRKYEVELISFDFFDEGVFSPLKDVATGFETKYFKGSDFPDFHSALKEAADSVTGDIMYVVKPRLPSFGLAMLVNATKKIPFILEINDLETVVSSPKAGDKHAVMDFDSVDYGNAEINNPYSNLWSNLLDPLVKQVPVLMTHNKGLDSHYNWQTLYMRNLKDERVYDPSKYDRQRIREELGFASDDRVILFGGLLRKHKGIYELVDLVERLKDSRFKLLFVGSRPTPDQAKLVEEFKDTITVLPPQDRESMARINYAADLVLLWLNPEVPASHYQFPYKATDAFAMRTPVIANDISDLGELGRQGYLRVVPFGDWQGIVEEISDLFSDTEKTMAMCDAAQRLFLRQFSFNAAITNFELAALRALPDSSEAYPVSRYFAKQYERIYKTEVFSKDSEGKNLRLINSELHIPVESFGSLEVDQSIFILDVERSRPPLKMPPSDVTVLVYAETPENGLDAARLFVKRAHYPVTVCIVVGEKGDAPAKLIKALRRQVAKYVVLTTQDAFPCRDWLEFAYTAYQKSPGKQPCPIYAATGGKTDSLYCHSFATVEVARDLLEKASSGEALSQRTAEPKFLIADLSEAIESNSFTLGSNVQLIDVKSLDDRRLRFHQEVCVIMPCIDQVKGLKTANLLQRKAGMAADIVVVKDTKRQGFIKTLNQAALCSEAEYVVYLAEDAIPGNNWLKIAYQALEEQEKSLLAFNCGKWHGRVAAFGMVRKSWVNQVYNKCILFDGYKAHRADNEITVIARAQEKYIYSVESILFEDDIAKDFKLSEASAKNFSEQDKALFKERYKRGFQGLISSDSAGDMFDEYFSQQKILANREKLEIV
ncbi:MAG: glycosyltransferase [Pseudomonadota bacterium]